MNDHFGKLLSPNYITTQAVVTVKDLSTRECKRERGLRTHPLCQTPWLVNAVTYQDIWQGNRMQGIIDSCLFQGH